MWASVEGPLTSNCPHSIISSFHVFCSGTFCLPQVGAVSLLLWADTPSTSSNMSETNSSKDESAQRSTIACQVCRRRKIKCGRELPHCNLCQQSLQNCTYPEKPLRPGPKIGSTQNPRKRKSRSKRSLVFQIECQLTTRKMSRIEREERRDRREGRHRPPSATSPKHAKTGRRLHATLLRT